MHGLYTPSAAFFKNTTTLHKISPGRAKTLMGTVPDSTLKYSRKLNPYVSFEERAVAKVRLHSKVCPGEQITRKRWLLICATLRQFRSLMFLADGLPST